LLLRLLAVVFEISLIQLLDVKEQVLSLLPLDLVCLGIL
jgi:hypothetical protein